MNVQQPPITLADMPEGDMVNNNNINNKLRFVIFPPETTETEVESNRSLPFSNLVHR